MKITITPGTTVEIYKPANDTSKAIPEVHGSNATPTEGHVIFALVSFFSVLIIMGFLTTRLMIITINQMNVAKFLVFSIYIGALFMHVAVGALLSGWDFTSPHLCWVAIIVCLSLYITNKILVYTFLLERIHHTRNIPRREDYLWFVAVGTVFAGFGAIVAFAFMNPVDTMSKIDGKCRIGLHNQNTLFLLGYDVAINLGITAIFLVQCYQWVRDLPLKEQLKVLVCFVPNAFNRLHATGSDRREWEVEQCKILLSKSLFGAIAIVISTIANLVILYLLHGHERGWLCFTTCTLDVTWGVIVIHWLTNKNDVRRISNPAVRGRRNSTHLPAGDGVYIEMQ